MAKILVEFEWSDNLSFMNLDFIQQCMFRDTHLDLIEAEQIVITQVNDSEPITWIR